jgi:hypothetical protein
VVLIVPLAALLVSCGGDDDAAGPVPGETAAATAGTGEAGKSGSPGGETATPTTANPAGAETAAPVDTPPPTAGGGEAGVRTDPGGNQIIVVPGCGEINVTELTQLEQFEELRARLSCILGQPEAVPSDVLAAARAADDFAAERLAEQDPEILLEDPPEDGTGEGQGGG